MKKNIYLAAILALLITLVGETFAADEPKPQGSFNALISRDDELVLVLSNAELRDVLYLLAEEYDLNVVMSDEVRGNVSLRLKGASLTNTLDAILTSRGFDYDLRDNMIRIGPAGVIEKERNLRLSKVGMEPLTTEVIVLRYLDANDVLPMVNPLLSPRGLATALEQRAYRGYRFGVQTGTAGQTSSSSNTTDATSLVRTREATEKPRSNVLTITDIPNHVEKIKKLIQRVDTAPRQVQISAKILEVTASSLEDLGLNLTTEAISHAPARGNSVETTIASGVSASTIRSDVFSNTFPAATDSGLHTILKNFEGENMTVTLHALLQDQKTRTLSAPDIIVLENQEATILVGEQFPIFGSTTSDQGTVSQTVSRFQPVGISLQVITQITPADEILMIVHPTVSSLGTNVVGSSGLTAPRINIREADTRVLVKDNETLVIGGLLEDSTDGRYFRIPILGNLPLFGKFFTRRQDNLDQRNLLIFITPRIVRDGQMELDQSTQLSFNGITDPGRYGLLNERRKQLKQIFELAKKDYKQKNYDDARNQFLKLLAIDPDHTGALKYLKKLKALPDRKPVG